MLRRKVLQYLTNWKKTKEKKCLVVQGARQVGKTFIIEQYAHDNYKEVLEINFKETPNASEIFSGNLDVESMLTAMKFRYPKKSIKPEETLIFLDEIQECPNAITSLKFWAIDNRFDVIASGSMLGIDYNRPSSYPVGFVDYVKMYGLDFEEFLWAIGITEDMIATLRTSFENYTPVPSAIHESMMAYFRCYMALGGMPEIVNDYVNTREFRSADRLQRALLQGYQYDIAHYANAEEKIKAEKCFLSLTKQLLDKENHKFQYKEIEHGARAQKYYSSIDWLLRADIVRLCKVVTDIRYDLEDYVKDEFFRVYTSDLSLLLPMKDFSLKQHIIENTLSGNTKGGLYECAIADILIKKGYPIYFYKNETTKKELDFLIQKDGNIIPIEVKSGKSKADSLGKLMEKSGITLSYKFLDGNVGTPENRVVSMPHYMAMFL
jgi:predicted AAA+ superfamily ATPase